MDNSYSESKKDWVLKIFCNPVILDNLLEYLSIEEIKDLRETSATINSEILKQKKFRKDVAFLVGREANFQSARILLNSCVSWKNIKVELYKDIGRETNDRIIRNLLKNEVEYLNLFFGKRKYFRPKYCPLFEDIWEHSEGENRFQNLNSILMPYNLLNIWKLQDIPFFGNNLKSLIFHTDQEKHFYNKWNCSVLSENLTFLAEKCKSLQEFGAPRVVKPAGDTKNGASIRRQTIRLVENNRETLTKLTILDPFFSACPELKSISCPSLTSLRLNFSDTYSDNVAPFLQKAPKLEYVRLLSTIKFPLSVVNVLKEKKQIKQLLLKSSKFDLITWEWISGMEFLEHLRLMNMLSFPIRSENGRLDFEQVWRNLPKSIKKLGLRNFKLAPNSTITLQPLANLKELCLNKCDNFVCDEVLQKIFVHVPNLETLFLCNCPVLTNSGITGQGNPVESCNGSIHSLKFLRMLTIKNCPKITSQIIESIRFQFLIKLNLGKNTSLTIYKSDVSSIVHQNPNLKSIHISKSSIPKYSRSKFSKLQDTAIKASEGRCVVIQLMGAETVKDPEDSESETDISTSENEFESESESDAHSQDLDSLQVQLREVRESLVQFQNRYQVSRL